MMKSLRVFISIFVLINCTELWSMDINGKDNPINGKDNPIIEFGGKKTKLLEHIAYCIIDPTYKFVSTSVIRLDEKGFFIKEGNISNLSRENIDNYILKNNWVYTSKYEMQKTEFSKDVYEMVGAIILGANDTKKVDDIRFLSMQALLKRAQQ